MVSFLYDHLNYLTDEEFKEKFPQSPPLDVQSFVEKPRLYIFGKSGKCKMKNEINWIHNYTEQLKTNKKQEAHWSNTTPELQFLVNIEK